MLEIGASGSMSGEGKRGVAAWPSTPPLLNSIPARQRSITMILAGDRQKLRAPMFYNPA